MKNIGTYEKYLVQDIKNEACDKAVTELTPQVIEPDVASICAVTKNNKAKIVNSIYSSSQFFC